MSARPRRARSSVRYVTMLALACAAAAGVFVWLRASQPALFALPTASAIPEGARYEGDAWYWIERGKGSAALVRTARQRAVIATADDIGGFGASAGSLAWSERRADRWTVRGAEADGSRPEALYEGLGPALGVWTDGKAVAFLAPAREQGVRAPSPNPSLGPKTALYVAERKANGDGRTEPRAVAILSEAFSRAEVLGKHDGAFFVLGVREGGIPVSVLYRVDADGQARRLMGEAGHCIGVLSSDGSVLVKAPSRESNDSLTACIIKIDTATGRSHLIADWMPAGGLLVETPRGVLTCSEQSPAAWLADGSSRAAAKVSVSNRYVPIGVAHDRILLLALGNRQGSARTAWTPLR